MNWPLVAAGSLSLMGSAIHGIVGDRIVRRIEEEKLPGNPFEGMPTTVLIRVTWHFVTIAFFVLGAALVAVGLTPETSAATGATYVGGATFLCWMVFAFVYGFKRGGGVRAFKAHPGPIVFLLTTLLIAWGSTRL